MTCRCCSTCRRWSKKYQRDRVYAMFSDDPAILREPGFSSTTRAIAFGSGGDHGQGPRNIPVGRHVPEAHNDMIFALIGEQFGFFGAVVLLGAYIVLFAAGIEIAARRASRSGGSCAVGIVVDCWRGRRSST